MNLGPMGLDLVLLVASICTHILSRLSVAQGAALSIILYSYLLYKYLIRTRPRK